MRRIITDIILISCVLTGCRQELESVPEGGVHAYASAPDAPLSSEDSKAYLNESVYRFFWASGDAISVVTGAENKKFTLTDGADSAMGGFYCPGDVVSGTHYAVYPYDEAVSLYGSNLKISYPLILKYDAQHRSAGANTMVAYGGNGLNFKFSNACSIVKFNLSGTAKLSAIEIVSKEGAPLSGDAMVSFGADGSPAVTMAGGEPKVKVDFGTDGFQLTPEAQPIFVSLPPAQLSEGLQVIFIEEGCASVSRSISIASLQRSTLLEMTPLELGFDQFIDLSVKGSRSAGLAISQTANCYVVDAPGFYKFPASLRGNSLESVGTPSKAKVIWETLGTSAAPSKGSIVKSNISYKDGYLLIEIPSPLVEGNALVACTDSNGNVLWSWHLWITAATFKTASFSGYNLMDRNLGALSASQEDGAKCFGMMYQWGRKDPFPGSSEISFTSPAAVAGTAVTVVTSNSLTGFVEFSVKNPTAYLNTSSPDWLLASSDDLWDVEKTMYDPCPPGYSLPGKDWTSGFTSALLPWSATAASNGRKHTKSGFWFPAAGKYSYHSATGDLQLTINQVGTQGRFWSASPNEGNGNAYGFGFSSSGISASNAYSRACAYSVRCAKD